jgi:hypothetical protein
MTFSFLFLSHPRRKLVLRLEDQDNRDMCGKGVLVLCFVMSPALVLYEKECPLL